MKEVAKLLGVELEEEFRMDNYSIKYKITKNGFMYWSDEYQQWNYTCGIEELFLGKTQIVKLPKQILDDVEKEYLSNVIKPFRKHIINIRKIQNYKYEFIEIVIYRTDEGPSCGVISFPYFNKGEMYKGMESNREYTLEELGL